MNNIIDYCNLNSNELWLVFRIYIASALPVVMSFYFYLKRKISYHYSLTLLITFFIASFGWELWMTYGLAGGLPVNLRRSDALNCAIPLHLNWLLNSLADVLVVWVGLFLLKIIYTNSSPFLKWKWRAFFILLLWFVAQNIYVEAFLYHLQLGSNGDISWAPFHPLGSSFNPILFEIMGRPITLQAQSSWILMTPLIYYLSIYFYKKFN
tara:strand:- start:6670 stop:7296 length:627 start_codon:yes stop_codon:yes gene_type:complete